MDKRDDQWTLDKVQNNAKTNLMKFGELVDL